MDNAADLIRALVAAREGYSGCGMGTKLDETLDVVLDAVKAGARAAVSMYGTLEEAEDGAGAAGEGKEG